MSCACAGSSESPPGSTSGVNALVGVSSFGGNVRVPNRPCGPPTCPQPPTSEAPVVAPYCPTWTRQLTPEDTGKLLITVDDCLHVLKSRCSGMLHYNADTERTSVIDPPFVSSIPQEKEYGYLAKVVPTLHQVCVDGSNECAQEVRQELAAQRMLTAGCGRLVIANPPLCGDVPPAEAADLQNQVRFDYLDPILFEDAACPTGVRFLVSYPGKRGSSQNQVDCVQWAQMRGLSMRASDWGMLLKTDPNFGTSLPAVFEKVPGTDERDPCFTLRISELAQGGLPADPNNCDIAVFRDKGLPTAGWKAEPKGLNYFPLAAPVSILNVSAYGNHSVTLPSYPENPCGKVVALIYAYCNAAPGISGQAHSSNATCNGFELVFSGFTNSGDSKETHLLVTAPGITIAFNNNFGASASASALAVKLLGYFY